MSGYVAVTVARQQGGKGFATDWPRKIVALKTGHTQISQRQCLLFRFDTFGDRAKSEIFTHIHKGLDDGIGPNDLTDILNKTAINFDRIERQVLQQGKKASRRR